MFSEINHSRSDDRSEIPASIKSNDQSGDEQPGAGGIPANQQSLTVIKIGGSTLGNHDTTLMDLVELQKSGENFVVIHGGGKTISEWMEKQGVRPKFVNGLRVTDSQSLDIVVGVLTGVINKSLVASINSLGGRAIGISGADGNMVNAEIADPQLGYVGKIKSVDTAPIKIILEAGYIPVIAPVGIHSDSVDHNKLLNINADTVAGYVSSAINADRMVFLTDVEGVLDSSKRLISRMTKRQADSLVASHVIDGGMIPKMEACIEALSGGAISQIVDGRAPGALKDVITGHNLGTRIG
jgi:acetylglutamate kinase|tara:strand:+ start:59 stop:949 length:891 start_codon:yes stop_codon:yes gene_type:complete